MATVNINVICNGTELKVHSLNLDQKINQHHSFRVSVASETVESKKAVNIDNSVNFLGQILEVDITPKKLLSGDGLKFKGIVTSVNIDRSYTNDNLIVLSGYSPTYLLEDGLGCKSYEENTGDDIFNEIVANYPVNLLNPSASGNYSEKIPYMVRYKETNFHFLSRLAAMYGEWLYYTGQELIYGKIQETNQVEITLGTDLQSYEYGVQIKPATFDWLSNDYTKNSQFNSSSKSFTPAGLDAYGQKAHDIAKSKFPGDYKMPVVYDIREEAQLKQRVELSKSGVLSDITNINGQSTNPSLTIGTNLSIYANNKIGTSAKKVFVNRFRVIGVQHHINANKDYQNSFKAIPYGVTVPPLNPNVYKIEAEKHTAIVKENNDPDKLGRVRVQFNWQQGNKMTPWIRVSTANASGDRGIYFTPEIGDEVMVDFEQANPNQPYVCDTLYHGQAKPEHFDADNNLKSIKTRSGHTVLFNDEAGGESITITDRNGNKIVIDTVGNNMNITALETMNFNARNMNFEVGQNVNWNVGQNASWDIGQDESKTVGMNMSANAGNNIENIASNKIDMNGGASVDMASGMNNNFSLAANGTANLATQNSVNTKTGSLQMKGTKGADIFGKSVKVKGNTGVDIN